MKNIPIRPAVIQDLPQLKQVALDSWSRFQEVLEPEHWQKLYTNLSSEQTYLNLLENGKGFVQEDENKNIRGMSFLMPSGQPSDLFEPDWCSIRFVTVHPQYEGKGLGKLLTLACINAAKENGEKTIALHTSEMMGPARHIYENLGFVIHREIEPRLGKRYWIYTLNL